LMAPSGCGLGLSRRLPLVVTLLLATAVLGRGMRHHLRLISRAFSMGPPAGAVRFGKFSLSPEQIFHESRTGLTVAFVNLKPIVPGHVLVVPRRVVARMADLTDDELCDLWRTARAVQARVEARHKCTASNVAVQDGAAAGQSVPHVHVHILPRRAGDFQRNDDVYDELESFDARTSVKLQVPDDEDRRPRTLEEMAAEARELRALFRD